MPHSSPGIGSAMRRLASLGQILGPGAIVAGSLAVEYGSQFARTVILARMLSPVEFGLVASINALISIVETSTSFGPSRYVVFVPDPEEVPALRAVHAVALVRGILLSAIVFLLAAPIASLLGEPRHIASFAAVALLPLLRGLEHFGPVQVQRRGNFLPYALAEGSGAIVGLATSTLAATIAPDHRAILWGLGVQLAWVVAATHLLSRTSYRPSFDRARIRDVMRFGLPLMINGAALAAAYQFDRMIVGGWLGVTALGIYGLTLTLMLQPVALVLRLATTLLQPRLSASWHADPEGGYRWLVRRIALAIGCLGFAGVVCSVSLGAAVFAFIFGVKYGVNDRIFVLLAFVALFRLGRGILGLFALASGRTTALMYSNLAGVLSLLATVATLAVYPAIEAALFGLLLAELIAFAGAAVRLDDGTGGWDRPISAAVVIAATPGAVLSLWILLANPPLEIRAGVAAAGMVGLALAAAVFYRRRRG